jgi:amino acid transporter
MPVEKGGHGLKRELRLRDLAFMQVALIFSLGWVGFAAKQGSTHLVLWLIGVVAFYLPLAAVVMKLSRTIPEEGGVYQWAKQGLSPFAGYMAGWGVTIYSVLAFSTSGAVAANSLAWAAGPRGAWMTASKPLALALQGLVCLAAYYVNVRGLHLAKWLTGASSILWFGISAVLAYLLGRAWIVGTPLALGSLSFHLPELSLATVAVLARMCLGALSGFESSAVFAEECRKPENDVGRSVAIASPFIALMYILGTASLLAYTQPAQIDVAAAVPQVFNAGFGSTGIGRLLTVLVVGTVTAAVITGEIIYIGMVARLPMVAGWDGLLPSWWTELDPRFRTPKKAIGAVVLAMMAVSIFSLSGAGNQEAYDLGTSAGNVSSSIMYMLLFATALFGFRSSPDRPAWHCGWERWRRLSWWFSRRFSRSFR